MPGAPPPGGGGGAAAAPAPDARPIPTRPAWLFGPKVDLIIGCGLWTIPMLAVVAGLNTFTVFSVALAFYYLSMVCNYPHYMATIYRAYGTADDFSKYRFFTIWATLAFIAMAVVTHIWTVLVPLFFTIYITWSPYHYTGQNFGLAMMFARRSGANPTRFDRNMLQWAFLGSYLSMIIGVHTGQAQDAFFVSAGLPPDLAYPIRIVSMAAFFVCGGYAIWRLIRMTNGGAMIATTALFGTQFLWFVAPGFFELFYQMPPPTVYFTTGALAFMHCSQYLWVTTYYARREAEAGIRGGGKWRPGKYALILIVGGIALFIPGPWLMSRLFHVDLMHSLLIFIALINIHHFMIDGAIWKLRDGKIAQLLLGRKADGTVSTGRVDAALTWVGRTIMSPAPFARGARYAAVSGLFVVAALDLAQTTMTLGGIENPRVADIAYQINPFDSRAMVLQAKKSSNEGRRDEAIQWLDRAITLNDRNVLALRMMGSLLVEGGMTEEAWRHYKQVELRVAPDIGTDINIALLSRERGDVAEAEKRLREAIRKEPKNRMAILNLGELLLEKGRDGGDVADTEEALVVYGMYLAMTPPELVNDPRERRTYLAVATRIGEGHVELGLVDEGVERMQETITLATQLQEWDFASKGTALIATLLEEANRPAEALMYHQHAVGLASYSAVPTDVALQWLNFAHFLERQAWSADWTYLAYQSASRRLERSLLTTQRIAARRGVERMTNAIGAAHAEAIDARADELRLELLQWQPEGMEALRDGLAPQAPAVSASTASDLAPAPPVR